MSMTNSYVKIYQSKTFLLTNSSLFYFEFRYFFLHCSLELHCNRGFGVGNVGAFGEEGLQKGRLKQAGMRSMLAYSGFLCWAKSVFLFVLSLHSHIFHDMNSHHPSQASSNRKLLSIKRLTYFLVSARHICRRQAYG